MVFYLFFTVEITHQLKLTEPKVIITVAECYDTIVKGLNIIQKTAKIVIIDNPSEAIPEGTIRFSEVGESGPIDSRLLDRIVRKWEDTVLLPFSSGTTGLPKGVELTNYNVMAALDIIQDEHVCLPKLTTGMFKI